ncbi:PREDICTED: uncharacterized protein LOC105965325 isoform X2 [Erythranthe guttata]|uniref:uncharacterized protein LOC105965325 isoform X2 n=1 Tax=Erythranthe guttata TaxID=4155 RepID=UPI00064DDA37|nr:PREDICTED: uncharacterized protein LOC105965325 isoform X2 [Erythranthe guttata]|eukprot:XP_012845323.1 PREDICTED: uncharacterized protein LOC105965325 isoform X2 [Erythranthe guttata]
MNISDPSTGEETIIQSNMDERSLSLTLSEVLHIPNRKLTRQAIRKARIRVRRVRAVQHHPQLQRQTAPKKCHLVHRLHLSARTIIIITTTDPQKRRHIQML